MIKNNNNNKSNNSEDKFYIWDEGYFDVSEESSDEELISPCITKTEEEKK